MDKKIKIDTGQVVSLGHTLKILRKRITKLAENGETNNVNITDDSELEGMEDNENDIDEKDEMDVSKSAQFETLGQLLERTKEIAAVEGHDSHSLSTLNEISQQIKYNDHVTALKKINHLIDVAMPFDYKEFFQLYDATVETAGKLKGKVCWVLLGPTGAGKSTSINLFCGSTFKEGIGGGVVVDVKADSLKDKDFKVGQNVTESQTRYIDAVEFSLKQFEKDVKFGFDEPKKILWVDSPGFEDTAGPEVNVANGIGTIRALKQAKKVKIIITFKEAHLESKFAAIRSIADNMSKAVDNLQHLLTKKFGSPVAAFLTKSTHGVDGAKAVFNKAHEETEEKGDSSERNSTLKALIFKLGIKGPLYDIKIDVEKESNSNEKTRVDTIKSLVEEVGYIQRPREAFNEFISISSKGKLQEQVQNDLNTIKNILDNDIYFNNPKYVRYIVDILADLDRLKDIIGNAAGNVIESKFDDCISIFTTKWNNKITNGSDILKNVNVKQCSVSSLQNKLKEFDDIKRVMKANKRAIRSSKYYKQLNDIKGLNSGLHECFDEIFEIIMRYLKRIQNQLNAYDSDTDADLDDMKSPKLTDTESKAIDNDNLDISNDFNDYENDKTILECVKKCFLMHQKYKSDKRDKHIKNSVKKFEQQLEKVIRKIDKGAQLFMDSKDWQERDNVSTLISMFSNLSKLNNISTVIDNYNTNNSNLNVNNRLKPLFQDNAPDTPYEISRQSSAEEADDDDYDDDEKINKSSKVENTMKALTNKLTETSAKTIKRICKSYSLNVLNVNANNDTVQDKYVDVTAILKSAVNYEMQSRESKLISFCEWLNELYDSLCNRNNPSLDEIDTFEKLKGWIRGVRSKWIDWLCGACLVELKECNELLTKGATSWNDVDKLLIECKSLRKVDFVQSETSQDYFKTTTEFDSHKSKLSDTAAELIEELNNGKSINFGKIIKIASQLKIAGCSKESNEMRQIHEKLNEYVNNLKLQTESIVLSVEMPDDLVLIEKTMTDLDTLQKFGQFMENIQDVNECYNVLNKQVVDVLKRIEGKYDLSQHSTENSKKLKEKLKIYKKMQSKIDKNVLDNVIMKCEFPRLNQLIKSNEYNINKLNNRNEDIDKIMEKKCGTVMEEKKKYEEHQKRAKKIMLYGEDDDLEQWLQEKGYKHPKEIKAKLEQCNAKLKTICNEEEKEKEDNKIKMDKLKHINVEVDKLLESENDLIKLKPDKVVDYRTDTQFLDDSIKKLEKLLGKDQSYLFTQKLSLHDAYNALNFLNQCKGIKWTLKNKIEEKESDVLTIQYVYEINEKVSKYLTTYGDILESNLNDLIQNLAVKDGSHWVLSNPKHRERIEDIVSKLSDCLREFREISNFDIQKKMQLEDEMEESNKKKQLKIVTCLFTNRDIQMGVTNYIGTIISDHKTNIKFKFEQWKVRNLAKLPLLRFICLSMSTLDRFVSSNKDDESYYRISAQIDGEITKSCDENTKNIRPQFENAAWGQLKDSLNALKKTANADEHGIGQKNYHDAVMQLFGLLNKLINDTNSKLLTEINTEYSIKDKNILKLKAELDKVGNLVEIMTDHLHDQSEIDKVENDRKALATLLSNRIKTLQDAAVKSAKRRDFKQCAERLRNLEKLTDSNYGFYINDITDETKIEEKDDKEDNVEEKSGAKNKKKTLRDKIDAELQNLEAQVAKANKSLTELTAYNPYQRLHLNDLYQQLNGSSDDQFKSTWGSIEDAIQETITDILEDIEKRNNQLQVQGESDSEFKSEITMTFAKQQAYFNKIEMSKEYFPKELKGFISAQLKKAKDNADENGKYIGSEFKRCLNQKLWKKVAESLKGFKNGNRNMFQVSRTQLIDKFTEIFNEFSDIMDPKNDTALKDITPSLHSYKKIGIYFTEIFDDTPPIIIGHIQNTLKQMYDSMENEFIKACKDIELCLYGQKEYKDLKESFSNIIELLQYKHELPENMVKKITEESTKLYVPIQEFIEQLNADKKKGLDRENYDIDKLFKSLDVLQELNNAGFHSNVQKLMPLIDLDEKEDIATLNKGIQNVKYDVVKKQTKDMLTEFQKDISEKGLEKEGIQQNYEKRLAYLKNVSNKCKLLVKSKSSNICKNHFKMEPEKFEQDYIKPCTKRMKCDIEKMQKAVLEALTRPDFRTAELQRANANMDAMYAIKNVFEQEINDEKLCDDIQFSDAIAACEDMAAGRIKQITDEIQVKKNIGEAQMEEYMQQCAQGLMNLEYFNQIINFKTSMNEDGNVSMSQTANELQKKAAEAVNTSIRFLSTHQKSQINNLYNHLLDKDANYGMVFTKKHTVFGAAFSEMMNQRFRELPIDDIIKNLKQTEQKFKEKKLMLNGMIGIDYAEIEAKFKLISDKYDELITNSLRTTASFEQLEQQKIPEIAANARNIAKKAVSEKNSVLESVKSTAKAVWSWASGSASKTDNPCDKYWTGDMRGAIPELVAHILAVWTLSSSSCYYNNKSKKSLMKARTAQIVAICCVLCLDIQDSKQRKLINNLVEVGTGEGKSVIIAVTATVLALLEFDVYCACYSELLSSRDRSAFDNLFLHFNVAKNIEYHTFNKILEKMINQGGDVREMAKNIVQGGWDEKSNYNIEVTSNYNNRRPKILFIDEVDKFFSTDFFGKQYTPSCVIPNKQMKDLILYVWKEYLKNGSNGKSITEQTIKQSSQYANLLNAFNPEWHDLLKETIKDIIDSIRTFKDDLYKIDRNGKDICYKFSDSYSSKVFYGYRTLFTYLYELERNNITDREYVHSKLTWFLKCGSFSYSEIPNDFYAILGVTGTLNSLSKKEHEVIQNSYGVKKYVVMPSLFDKEGKLIYARNRDISVIDVSKHNFDNELYNFIKTYENNDTEDIKRPVIVFFKDEQKLNDFYKGTDEKTDVCKQWRDNDRIQLLTPDLTAIEKQNGIINATKPNQITLATEEYGRGIDFQIYDKKLETKGLHVELTYWPETLAEEIQIKGRTARQGQRGTFHIILNEDQIIDQCEVTSEEIRQYKDDGKVYEWLNKIRNKVFEKQYDKASNFVSKLKPIHKESEELATSLRTKNVRVAKQQLLYFNKGANIQSAAKLSIVIDATGSMASCLTQCKTVIQKTIPELVQFLKNNNLDTDQFEIQVVAYRNYNADASSILESCEFTSSESRLTTFIHSLKAQYGRGDEAIEVAFAHLNKQNKKPNLIMLMADAPAHTKSDMMRKRQEKRGENYWMTAGGIFRNKLDWNEELRKFMNGNNGTSVFCFYLKNRAKGNFDQIASIAGGKSKSMSLNISNEDESIALLQSALSEAILFKMNNGNMDLVNKFREQNKNMPTFL